MRTLHPVPPPPIRLDDRREVDVDAEMCREAAHRLTQCAKRLPHPLSEALLSTAWHITCSHTAKVSGAARALLNHDLGDGAA